MTDPTPIRPALQLRAGADALACSASPSGLHLSITDPIRGGMVLTLEPHDALTLARWIEKELGEK